MKIGEGTRKRRRSPRRKQLLTKNENEKQPDECCLHILWSDGEWEWAYRMSAKNSDDTINANLYTQTLTEEMTPSHVLDRRGIFQHANNAKTSYKRKPVVHSQRILKLNVVEQQTPSWKMQRKRFICEK